MSDATVYKIVSFFKELIPYVVILIFVLLLKTYVITPIKVNGESMNPTLEDGEIMILDIISYRLKGLKRFDIVVINQGKELIIKRVIGLPGERIKYKDGELYINDTKVKDPYTGSNFTEDFELTIPKDEYYVLGDNRGNSLDSRVFGTFTKKQVLGKTDFIIYPFKQFGLVKPKEEEE
ncbi:MAG: signal peptidase I [Bacilli bacterium]|nr:signal peptidase I [Bacilli bacterium]